MKTKRINQIYLLSFFFTLHVALSAYVNSTFLTNIISEKYVGILYVLSSLATLFLLSKSVNLLKSFGNRKTTLVLLLINMVSIVGMIASQNPYLVSLSFIAFVSTNTQIFLSIDIFIQHFGNKDAVGKSRGLYLTITNIAWVLSPVVAAFLITKEGGYQAVYTLAFIFVVIMTIGLMLSIRKFEDRDYQKTPFIGTYRYLRINRHMFAVTIINFILQFFYAFMVIYSPIYLYNHIGLDWGQIGIIFTIMLTPFVLFGVPIGKLIDGLHFRKRTLFYAGFIVLSLSTFLISQITTTNILVWIAVLFMTRIGASIIETTSEIYFFFHIKEEDASLISIFRDMMPLAYIIAPAVATIIFIFLPFEYLFIILSIFLLIAIYYIPHLKPNYEYILSHSNK